MTGYGWIAIYIVAGCVAALYFYKLLGHWKQLRKEMKLAAARDDFRYRREMLEAKFITVANERGVPRGLRWMDCRFEDEITYARDRTSGELSALVAVTIAFEAIEGGGMEEVEAVTNLRAATAVFTFDGNQWTASGRAIFNLNPEETIEHFRDSLVMVAQR